VNAIQVEGKEVEVEEEEEEVIVSQMDVV